MIRRFCIAGALFLMGILLFGESTYRLHRIEQDHAGVIQQIAHYKEAMRNRRRSQEAISATEWNEHYRQIDALKKQAPGYVHYVDYHYAWVTTALLFAGLGVFVLLLPRKRRYVR